MKKLFILFIFLILPLTVNAENKIISHYIDAEIEIAGGLRVKELIIVEGNYEFFGRNINYKMVKEDWDKKTIDFNSSPIYNGYSLENVKVSAFKVDEIPEFNSFGDNITYFEEYKLNDLKKDGTYTVAKNDLGYFYNINQKTNNEKYAFYFEYIIGNIVVAHEDISEINFTLKNIGIGAEQTILRVILPYPTDDERYHFWLHGPASTVLEELINSNDEKIGFVAQANNLTSDLNFRMTLPKEHVGIDMFLNHSGVDGLKAILKAEGDRVEAFNFSTSVLKAFKYTIIGISITYALGSLILLKIDNKIIFYLYLVIGALLTIFNFLLKYHFIWLYAILICPLTIKGIKYYKKI